MDSEKEEAPICSVVDGCVPKGAAAIRKKAGKAAAVSAAKVAGGVDHGDKHAADVAPATAAEVDDDDTTGNEEPVRLSQSLVNCILGLKPEVVEDPDEYYARLTNDPDKLFSQEYIDRGTEIRRHLAESSARIFAEFEKFQAWVRAEFNEKGYVEVDDDFIAQRIMVRRLAEEAGEEWPGAFGPMEGLKVADT